MQRLGVLDPQASAVETGAQIPGNESGMHREDGADRVEVVTREAECAPQPCRGDRAGADPLRGGDALGRGVVGPFGDGDHQGPHQKMVLHEKFAADAEEGRSRQTLEGKIGIERAAVILPAVAIAADRVEAEGRETRRPDLAGDRRFLDRLGVGVDEHLPEAVRHPIGGCARRAVDRPAARARVARHGAGVEGRILDVMAHRDDGCLAVRLDLEQRAAVRQPEAPRSGVSSR